LLGGSHLPAIFGSCLSGRSWLPPLFICRCVPLNARVVPRETLRLPDHADSPLKWSPHADFGRMRLPWSPAPGSWLLFPGASLVCARCVVRLAPQQGEAQEPLWALARLVPASVLNSLLADPRLGCEEPDPA
jgi:hypothetical protein